ncbi:hypothetical protein BDW22DRAFT_510316 [Trametopsis cervina]|nr:hypothetical protein BDW22DRAFT_510316 [Trametopsis cervina]
MAPPPLVARTHAGAPTARSTPVPSKKALGGAIQYVPEQSSPLVYPSPKVPAPKNRKPSKPTVNADKPGFRRLATDRSDDISDFDDQGALCSPVQNIPESAEPPKIQLGKRERTANTKNPIGGRHEKRLVRDTVTFVHGMLIVYFTLADWRENSVCRAATRECRQSNCAGLCETRELTDRDSDPLVEPRTISNQDSGEEAPLKYIPSLKRPACKQISCQAVCPGVSACSRNLSTLALSSAT